MSSSRYRNFRVAVYVPASIVRKLADPDLRVRQWETLRAQVEIDKVYLEYTRDRQTVEPGLLEELKAFFAGYGVEVAGGLTLSERGRGQFQSLCYTNPEHRDFVRSAAEVAATHFDEVILDDFFFTTTKTAEDIAAKGSRSWTQYRLDVMDDASRTLVIQPAKTVNPKVKLVIKYPNWYEHFPALGYDLERGPRIFDGIYTGTETREPTRNDQCLQQYESYLIFRYFSAIRPGANGGGWVDTFGLAQIDRYVEQLWDTVLAKAPEITLFNWANLLDPLEPGARAAWQERATSVDFGRLLAYRTKEADAGANDTVPVTMARAAGYALAQMDRVVGKLGRPVGVASYRTYRGGGEDYLHNYLGMLGIPIELCPEYPSDADVVLLTESAKYDEDILDKIKNSLLEGKRVVITSGLLSAMQHWGIQDIAEITPAGGHLVADSYSIGFGPGKRDVVAAFEAGASVAFPRIRFATNDSWALASAVSDGATTPVFLMNRYGDGVLFVWAMPHNFRHLYRLPRQVTQVAKDALMKGLFVRLDGPSQVALMPYDNRTFVVQSFLDTEVGVQVSVAGGASKIRDLSENTVVRGIDLARRPHESRQLDEPRTCFDIHVMPHSYRVFGVES